MSGTPRDAPRPRDDNQPGFHRGRHYTEWVDTVKAHKRAGRDTQALDLLEHLMNAVEAEFDANGLAPAPWYYEQAAILYRKRRDFAAEVAILERFAAIDPSRVNDKLAARLRRARQLVEVSANGQQQPACPSCGALLPTMPSRSRACPTCREPIVIQRRDGVTRLLTAAAAEAEALAHEIAGRRERHLARANRIGCSDDRFAAIEAELVARHGAPVSTGDVFWAIANETVANQLAAPDWEDVGRTYREMAEHLAERGEDWYEVAAQAVAAQVRRDALWTDPDEHVSIAGCHCEPCQAPPRTVGFGALADGSAKPIPHHHCVSPPCRCWYYTPPNTRPASHTIRIEVNRRPGWLRRLFGR